MYIKKKVNLFNEEYPNISSFIDYVKLNFDYLNFDNIIISDKINSIYQELLIENDKISFKLAKIIRDKFNFIFKNRLQIGFWDERGYDNSKEIVADIQKINSGKVKNRFIPNSENLLKFGYDKETVKKWRCGPNMIKYWMDRGYSEDESKIRVSEYQTGLTKYIDYDKRVSDTTKEYYMNKGYSLDESIKLLSDRQNTINLDKYVLKYGYDIGVEVYNDKVLKRSDYLGCSKKGYSDISQELFNELLKIYKSSEFIFYAEKNNEYKINKEKGYWLYDFTDIKNKKIIEFQGDRYHANPNIFNDLDKPHPYLNEKLASDIWKDDEIKMLDAEKEGFDVFYVWESDYKKNKNLVIEKCIKFLQGKIK